MGNITTMPQRQSAKPHKQHPETSLAHLEREGDPIRRFMEAIAGKPHREIYNTHPLASIQRAIDDNKKLLANLPSDSEVQNIAAVADQALSVTTENVVDKQIGLLLGAYPNAAPTNPEAYVALLKFDIIDAGIPDAITFMTCRELRRTQKFLPTISEFLSIAKRHIDHWSLARRIPARLNAARDDIEAAVSSAERTLVTAREGIEAGWRDEDGNIIGKRELNWKRLDDVG